MDKWVYSRHQVSSGRLYAWHLGVPGLIGWSAFGQANHQFIPYGLASWPTANPLIVSLVALLIFQSPLYNPAHGRHREGRQQMQ
jgi:hypothetical protein